MFTTHAQFSTDERSERARQVMNDFKFQVDAQSQERNKQINAHALFGTCRPAVCPLPSSVMIRVYVSAELFQCVNVSAFQHDHSRKLWQDPRIQYVTHYV